LVNAIKKYCFQILRKRLRFKYLKKSAGSLERPKVSFTNYIDREVSYFPKFLPSKFNASPKQNKVQALIMTDKSDKM